VAEWLEADTLPEWLHPTGILRRHLHRRVPPVDLLAVAPGPRARGAGRHGSRHALVARQPPVAARQAMRAWRQQADRGCLGWSEPWGPHSCSRRTAGSGERRKCSGRSCGRCWMSWMRCWWR